VGPHVALASLRRAWGPVSLAIAAVDTALWDLRGRTLREPLWHLLGGHRPEVRAYAGNIDLNFPREKLLEGVRRSLEAVG